LYRCDYLDHCGSWIAVVGIIILMLGNALDSTKLTFWLYIHLHQLTWILTTNFVHPLFSKYLSKLLTFFPLMWHIFKHCFNQLPQIFAIKLFSPNHVAQYFSQSNILNTQNRFLPRTTTFYSLFILTNNSLHSEIYNFTV
jgi:hypothetical protein